MKRLLLIGLRYHIYTDEIAAEFERLGFVVTFYEVQPRSLLFKTARRALPAYYGRMIERHHRAIIAAETGKSYNFVVFIQAHQFSVENIDMLRRQHAESTFVLYNWDSLTTDDYRPQMHAFDKVFTFDKHDAKALHVNYLPLFCIRSFQAMNGARTQGNAIYVIGNIVNPRRYLAVKAFGDYCKVNGIPFYRHLACSIYNFYRLLRAGIIPSGISFSYIKEKNFLGMICNSSAVFDFANHRQTGYTMRVMENLCMGKKLITNNANILNEPFYSPDRVLVYRDLDFSGVKAFLSEKVTSADTKFEEYYIQTFARRLIGLN